MKKIISVVIFFVLISVFSVCAFASDNTAGVYTYVKEGVEYTVDFSGASFSADKHDAIAQRLLGFADDKVQTYGLMCTLFGHKYEESTISVITHKVRTYAPRCKDEAYDVKICTRCDYQEQTLITTSYVDCCPED